MGFLRNRPLALCCAVFVLTVTACEFVFFSTVLLPIFSAASLVSLAALILFRSHKLKKPLALTALFLLCVSAGLFSHYFAVYKSEEALCSFDTEVEIAGEIGERLYSSNGENCYSLSVYYINAGEASGKVLFSHRSGEPLECGTVIRSTVTLERPQNTAAYGERAYLHSNGITAIASKTDNAKTEIIGNARSLSSAVLSFRNAITDRINAASRGKDAGLLTALLTGDRSGIAPTTALDFSRAGISHLLAISGLHFTIIASAAMTFLKTIKIKRGWRSVLVCLLSLIYASIAGLSYSVFRAMLMLFSVHSASLFSRDRDVYTSLFSAVALIVLIEPYAVASCGMWLSFFATLGVVFAAKTGSRIRERLEDPTLQKAFSLVAEPLITGAFAVLLPLPVTLAVFGNISPLSPLSTVICSPLVEILMFFSVIFAIAGAPMGFITDIAGSVAALTVRTAQLISDNIEPISIKSPLLCGVFVVASILSYIAVLVPRARKRSLILLLCCALIFPSCLGLTALTDNRALAFSAQSRSGADVICVSHGNINIAIASSNASASNVNAAVSAVSAVGKTDIDMLILTELTESSDKFVLKLAEKIKIRTVLYPEASTGERQAESALIDAVRSIRAECSKYIRRQSIRANGTEITVFGESTSDTFVSVSNKNADLLYISEGAQTEKNSARIRYLARECDALVLGIAGTNAETEVHFSLDGVRCVVIPSKDYRKKLSARMREDLEKLKTRYADTDFRVFLPTD